MDQERKFSKGGRICSQCGAGFVCGLLADNSAEGDIAHDVHCWCFDLPPMLPVRADTACLCPACLTNAIRQQTQVSPEEKM